MTARIVAVDTPCRVPTVTDQGTAVTAPPSPSKRPTVEYRIGDSRQLIRELPDASVDLVTASPPFLALRDYGTGNAAEIGKEGTPAEFLAVLLDLAVECRRVLTPHGSLAFELGDSFSGSGGAGSDYNEGGLRDGQAKFTGTARVTKPNRRDSAPVPRQSPGGNGWPLTKSLCGIPTLFAWSLAYGRNMLAEPMTAVELLAVLDRAVSDGSSAADAIDVARAAVDAHDSRFVRRFDPWRIRNVIVWARNNPPVGALGDKVRPATSYITVATPSANRWFDLDAVRVGFARDYSGEDPGKLGLPEFDRRGGGRTTTVRANIANPAGAPPRDHWTDEYDGDLTWLVNTQGSSLAHFAMWPSRLAERLVLSMCPREVCTVCGEPRRRVTDTAAEVRLTNRANSGFASRDGRESGPTAGTSFATVAPRTLGWTHCGCCDGTPTTWRKVREPVIDETTGAPVLKRDGTPKMRTTSVVDDIGTCHGGHYRPGVVLDPFAGTGTTMAVAEHHGRDAIGFDLDARNRDVLWPKRRREVLRNLGLNVPQTDDNQLSLI